MNIISELYKNKRSYFLALKGDDTLCCGGNEGGRFYGIIEIQVLPESVVVNKTVSNGVTSSMNLSPEPYSSATDEYKLAAKLLKEVTEYLSVAKNRVYQDENREGLMSNTLKLLPLYEN